MKVKQWVSVQNYKHRRNIKHVNHGIEESDSLQVICEGGKCNGKTNLPKSKKERAISKPIDFLEESFVSPS